MRHLFIAQTYLRFYAAAQFWHWAAFHMQVKLGNNKKTPAVSRGQNAIFEKLQD